MPVCPQCDNRHFNTKEALLQHMRSSSAWHPFCTSCDRRFVSQTAYDAVRRCCSRCASPDFDIDWMYAQHMAAKHPPTFDCTLCNRPYHAPFALEDHYRGSNVHPNCTKCGRGFRDQAACDEVRVKPPQIEPNHISWAYNHISTAPRCTQNRRAHPAGASYFMTTSCKTIIGTPPTIRNVILAARGARTSKFILRYACITPVFCQH